MEASIGDETVKRENLRRYIGHRLDEVEEGADLLWPVVLEGSEQCHELDMVD